MMGYNWSNLSHLNWGFYRLNYEKNGQKEFEIIDIDFNTEKEHSFSHIHGGKSNSSLFRVDGDQITTISTKFGRDKILERRK
jgi:hypothetical protein